MVATDEPKSQKAVEELVGHPDVKFHVLSAKIQDEVVTRFSGVQTDFLDLIWTLDQYRVRQVVPRGMGDKELPPDRRLEGIYRGKGNYFSAVITLILDNKTTSRLASRTDVQGFSQTHQIDIAWPARDAEPLVDPYICAEAKLTGAPAYPGNKGRGAMQDWSNRRKELKFQATDLKLYRHMAERSEIDHWDVWRRQALPHVYSLWAARMRPTDKVQKMIEEARTLTDTYCDGVGIYAFRENDAEDGYEPTPLARGVSSRVTSLDSVLEIIAVQIQTTIRQNQNKIPEPVVAPFDSQV